MTLHVKGFPERHIETHVGGSKTAAHEVFKSRMYKKGTEWRGSLSKKIRTKGQALRTPASSSELEIYNEEFEVKNLLTSDINKVPTATKFEMKIQICAHAKENIAE